MTLHLLAFSGSLRKRSYNSALLRACADLLPPDMTLEIFDLAPLPMYNDDVYHQGFPAEVQHFRERIVAADALLIATPEYNHSIPGALKNAIDWASRPDQHGYRPLNWKPAGIMGVVDGGYGAVTALSHLREILASVNCYVVSKPAIRVPYANKKFDADLRLTDEATRTFVRKLLVELADFAPRFADLAVKPAKA
ncbi:MAG: NAD(P)H-dependent oxidoreductase [Chloroflexota bacterium]